MKKVNNIVPNMEDPSPFEFLKQVPAFKFMLDEDIM